jgi:hypothetical protein
MMLTDIIDVVILTLHSIAGAIKEGFLYQTNP